MDCQWLCIFNELHMLDELVHNLSYIAPTVSLGRYSNDNNYTTKIINGF